MKLRLVLAILAAPAPAIAAPPDKAACIAAFDRGQQARSDEKLRRARDELLVCSNEACPAVLRKDCASVLGDVQAVIPTVVLSAQDDRGADIVDVRVTLDGQVIATRLDGKAMEIDPGEHVFRFDWQGKTHEERIPVREGEKSRPVRVSFRDPVGWAPKPAAQPAPTPQRSTVGWVVPSALAVASVAGFAIAGISRLHFDSQVDGDRAAGGCAPDCTEAHRDDLSKSVVTANVALVSGLVLLGGAVISWIVLGPSTSSRGESAARAW
ncbi:MAG TPA: hypothetical protein VIF62_18720 [Labilithrix sp.]